MKAYVIKFNKADKEALLQYIQLHGGEVEYSSPVLPIIHVKLTKSLKAQIQDSFDLIYIVDDVEGVVQEFGGELSAVSQNSIFMIPTVDNIILRKNQALGWGVTIAVLDSGVDEEWINEKDDYSGYGLLPAINHGTIVAKIIKHFSPGSIINSYKVCHNEKVRSSDFLTALNKAAESADIINMSVGFDIKTCTKENPCSICEHVNFYAENRGTVFVAAAGNKGEENTVQCPGNAIEAITVGAVDSYKGEQLAEYSSRGVPGIKKPNIVASGTVLYKNGEKEESVNGTSFATPLISGVVGAIFPKVNKELSKVKSYLFSTAKDLELPEHHQGFGSLDLNKLVGVLYNEEDNIKSKEQKSN